MAQGKGDSESSGAKMRKRKVRKRKLTNKELAALPERRDYENETLPTGETVRRYIAPRFVPYPLNPCDVIAFIDANGEKWLVDYHLAGGPYKRRALV